MDCFDHVPRMDRESLPLGLKEDMCEESKGDLSVLPKRSPRGGDESNVRRWPYPRETQMMKCTVQASTRSSESERLKSDARRCVYMDDSLVNHAGCDLNTTEINMRVVFQKMNASNWSVRSILEIIQEVFHNYHPTSLQCRIREGCWFVSRSDIPWRSVHSSSQISSRLGSQLSIVIQVKLFILFLIGLEWSRQSIFSSDSYRNYLHVLHDVDRSVYIADVSASMIRVRFETNVFKRIDH